MRACASLVACNDRDVQINVDHVPTVYGLGGLDGQINGYKGPERSRFKDMSRRWTGRIGVSLRTRVGRSNAGTKRNACKATGNLCRVNGG